MAIISSCLGQDDAHVFTYICRRRGGEVGKSRVIGGRYPVTYSGMKSQRCRISELMGLEYRFHDARHAVGSRLTRSNGLKVAQMQLGHASIKTTAKFYAHAHDEDLRNELDAAITPSSAEQPAASNVGNMVKRTK